MLRRSGFAALLGMGVIVSFIGSAAPSYAAQTVSKCNSYGIGKVCVSITYSNGTGTVTGHYSNTGASTHNGHMDIYQQTAIVTMCGPTSVPVNHSYSCSYFTHVSTTWRADWVNSVGTHYRSPNLTF